MQKIHNFKTTVLIRECNKQPVTVVPNYCTKSLLFRYVYESSGYYRISHLRTAKKNTLVVWWCACTYVCVPVVFDTLRNKLINFYESCMNFMPLSSSWSSLFLTCMKGSRYVNVVCFDRNKHVDDAEFLLTLVCVTNSIYTKCILHTLSILQHVSAHHTYRHQGVCVGVIITLSSGLLYTRWMNSQLCTRTHSKILLTLLSALYRSGLLVTK
jgi:hypothetical protein